MEQYKYDVFISYSRKDTPTVDRICESFDRAGISYFIDRQGIAGGLEFPAVLAQAIRESKVFLFLASRNSYGSKFTQSEVVYAFNKKQKQDIFPYIIDDSELPEELAFTFSAINWRTMKQHPIDPVLVNDILLKLGRLETQKLVPGENAKAVDPKKFKFTGKLLAQIVLGVSLFCFLLFLIIFLVDRSVFHPVDNPDAISVYSVIGIVLFFASFIMLLVGLIRPKSIDLPTRKEVLKFYLTSFIILFFSIGFTGI